LPSQEIDNLERIYHGSSFIAWGAVPGLMNEMRWDKMNPGDVVLIYNSGRIRFAGEIAAKVRNKDLARYFWKKDDAGSTWGLMYFIVNEERTDVEISKLFIVASKERKRRVFEELKRPTFSGPCLRLNKVIRFVGYDQVRDIDEVSKNASNLDSGIVFSASDWKQLTEFSGATDWIFARPVKIGKLPYSYTGVWRELERAAKLAGIGHLGTHAFRHTYRSWLDAVGTAIAVQQKMMRHTDIRTTMNIYGDVVTDEMTTASAKVAQLAFRGNGAQTERNQG
jgi:hypothetical protein